MRSTMLIPVGAFALAASLALANPGDPFGGDDTGCAPDTKEHSACEFRVAKSLARLVAVVTRCHITQAGAAFRGAGFGEGGCEEAARAKLDKILAKLAADGICPQAVLDNAAAEEATLLAGQTQTSPPSLDALNGSMFCDPTSNVLLADTPGDPDADDAGYVPATPENLRCAVVVAKNVAKLWVGIVVRCHVRAAALSYKGEPADDEACEDGAIFGVRSKYDKQVDKLVAANICPPCLDAAGQAALGDAIEARVDQENGLVFVCPAP